MAFNFSKLLDLPPQLQWKHTDELELQAWTIRARNYNTFVANGIFTLMTVLTLGGAFIMYAVYEGMSQPWRILSCAFYFVIALSIVSSMTHQRINFAYRITSSGVEYCKWKNFPKSALTFLKWFSGITAILFIYLATLDPAFLFGLLIGPGGMGLTYLSMANSKNYQAMHTQFNHYAFKWSDITQLAIATNREVVNFKYSVTLKGDRYETHWSLNLFCHRNQKEAVATLIKPYLSPNVPVISAKVNVPMSTDPL
ncbi:hypothetical protein ACW9H6_27985 [Pseudomonas sp. SDO528_S397]